MTTEIESQKLEFDVNQNWQSKGDLPYIQSSSIQGAGIALRSLHYQYILTEKPKVNWFEVLSDNYFCAGGLPLFNLEKFVKIILSLYME